MNSSRVRDVRLLIDGEPETVALDEDVSNRSWEDVGVVERGPVTILFQGGAAFETRFFRASGVAAGAAADGAIVSPMPGRIIAVDVAAGERVAEGARLVTREAMKMEHALLAPFDGIVAGLVATAGGQVAEGALLVRIEHAADASA